MGFPLLESDVFIPGKAGAPVSGPFVGTLGRVEDSWRRRAFRDRDEERDPRPGEIVEKRSGRQGTDSKSVRAGSLGAQEFAEGGGAGGRVRIEGNRRDAC